MTRSGLNLAIYRVMRKFKSYPLGGSIIIIEYRSKKDLRTAMLRAVHGWDPQFKTHSGTTLKNLKRTYSRIIGPLTDFPYEGFCTYPQTVRELAEGRYGILSKAERELFRYLCRKKGWSAAVIVSKDSATSTVRHEMAHALYYSNKQYREGVHKILRTVKLGPIYSILKEIGYGNDRELLKDEAHAYLLSNPGSLEYWGLKNPTRYAKACFRLSTLFEKHTDQA